MPIDTTRKALGRGLGALIPGASTQASAAAARGIHEIPLGEIHANKYQPRKSFDEAALEELAASIKEKGVLQPIVVRKSGDHFELIAGERRLRACKKAALATIPALIKDVSDLESLELALIENIQRRDLNPIEEAQSYASLVNEFKLSQEDLARRVGRERSTVANMLRLLKLPDAIQRDVAGEILSMGHARALLSLSDHAAQMQVRAEVIARQLSVRATEALVAKWRPIAGKKPDAPKKAQPDIEMRRAETDLKKKLGAKVAFKGTARKGRIEIAYATLDELNRILAVILD